MKKLNLFLAIAVLASVFTGCIGSKEAYDKSKLSSFVATQTKQIIRDAAEGTTPGLDMGKLVQETSAEVKALDDKMNQANAEIKRLESKIASTEKVEKEAKAEFERSNITSVFFALSSSTLTESAMQELYRWKLALERSNSQYNYSIVVYASADRTGSSKTNDALRAKRADAVKSFLVKLGCNAANIQVITSQPPYNAVENLDRRAVIGISVK
jgi:outer membrane protein OmpA-like peptidoglycan-associated protein